MAMPSSILELQHSDSAISPGGLAVNRIIIPKATVLCPLGSNGWQLANQLVFFKSNGQSELRYSILEVIYLDGREHIIPFFNLGDEFSSVEPALGTLNDSMLCYLLGHVNNSGIPLFLPEIGGTLTRQNDEPTLRRLDILCYPAVDTVDLK